MDNEAGFDEDHATLDPPGTIAVVGAGPLGIEAALYGRFLGYGVTLFEADAVAGSMASQREQPIPMMPDRSASPLANAALDAQSGDNQAKASPMLIGEWIDQVWLPLTDTDLLRGRLRCPARVTAIDLVVQHKEDESSSGETDESVAPDFRLTLDGGEANDFEAVILAIGGDEGITGIKFGFPRPADYLFSIGGARSEEKSGSAAAENEFWNGLKEIVDVYASLGGRADLDLYRPLRG